MNATAFGKSNPFGSKLNAIFSSDIGHFDVPDMAAVVPEAYELVEDGLITADDFRDFTFANAVRLWGTQNPDFFKGTVVARQAVRCSALLRGRQFTVIEQVTGFEKVTLSCELVNGISAVKENAGVTVNVCDGGFTGRR